MGKLVNQIIRVLNWPLARIKTETRDINGSPCRMMKNSQPNMASVIDTLQAYPSLVMAIFPHQDALEDRQILRSELHANAYAIAKALTSIHALQVGDRIGIHLLDHPAYLSLVCGAWLAGVTVVLLPVVWSDEEIQVAGTRTPMKLILTGANKNDISSLTSCPTVLSPVDLAELIVKGEGIGGNVHTTAAEIPAETDAVVIYTSGTVAAKPVVHSQRSLTQSAETRWFLAPKPTKPNLETVFVATPLSGLMGLLSFTNSIQTGATIIYGFHKTIPVPTTIANLDLSQSIHILSSMTPDLYDVADSNDPAVVERLKDCKLFFTGGSNITSTFTNRIGNKFPQVQLVSAYGTTETLGTGTMNFNCKSDPTLGMPMGCVDVRIVDAETGAVLTSGQGEICLRSPCQMQRYEGMPTETAHCLRDGWVLTGDLGYVDWWGQLHLVGRKKDIFIVNGLNISCLEVEALIAKSNEDICEVCVIPVEDAKQGEHCEAAITVRGGSKVTSETIAMAMKENGVPPRKMPHRILICDELPRATTGKHAKQAIRKLLTETGDAGRVPVGATTVSSHGEE